MSVYKVCLVRFTLFHGGWWLISYTYVDTLLTTKLRAEICNEPSKAGIA
jgi:hypothetical protein